MAATGDRMQVETRRLVIVNERGLHARAAAKFVTVVGEHAADVEVSKDGQTVSGRSIMGLMMLAAGLGSVIEVTARGADARRAIDAVETLVRNRFDE